MIVHNLKAFVRFWYDFIVGDDWFLAAGVVVLLAAAGVLAHANEQVAAWLLVPIGVALIQAVSLWRATSNVDLSL